MLIKDRVGCNLNSAVIVTIKRRCSGEMNPKIR